MGQTDHDAWQNEQEADSDEPFDDVICDSCESSQHSEFRSPAVDIPLHTRQAGQHPAASQVVVPAASSGDAASPGSLPPATLQKQDTNGCFTRWWASHSRIVTLQSLRLSGLPLNSENEFAQTKMDNVHLRGIIVFSNANGK
ncbi:hypothetical protein HaLaN_24507 [Haematococcus lacustris]|uniref:Uncharacterized protein n=1 Tax=Haematococcus lacustris TaxID=44745 RepID=A0A6A0A3G9_HAELA|nr:hypothetical protein HaLaN_24507 [Haematococcus lacustris]